MTNRLDKNQLYDEHLEAKTHKVATCGQSVGGTEKKAATLHSFVTPMVISNKGLCISRSLPVRVSCILVAGNL